MYGFKKMPKKSKNLKDTKKSTKDNETKKEFNHYNEGQEIFCVIALVFVKEICEYYILHCTIFSRIKTYNKICLQYQWIT